MKKILSNTLVSYLIAIVLAFIASGVFIAAMGYNPLKAYQTILFTSFRTVNGLPKRS